MAAKNLHQQTVEIRITEMGKTNNKNKQTTQSKIVNKNLCIHLNAITKKTKQTTTKQAVVSKNTTTDNVANKQEKQKNTNFVKQTKKSNKNTQKKAGTTSNHAPKYKHKKTQRITIKQAVGDKNNTPDNLVAKTRKNDKKTNFTKKNKY